jgi:hypothetical protein
MSESCCYSPLLRCSTCDFGFTKTLVSCIFGLPRATTPLKIGHMPHEHDFPDMPAVPLPVPCPYCQRPAGRLLPPAANKDGDTLYFCTQCHGLWKGTDEGPIILTPGE